MAEISSDFMMKLTGLLGQDKDAITKKIEGLGIDDVIGLLDATATDDTAKIKAILGKSESLDDDNSVKIEDPTKSESAEDEDKFIGNIGDDVRVGDEEGTIKIPHGPNNTVGVMIDGKLRMVKAKDVKPLKEGVLGFAPMLDLQRMQQLAGIAAPEAANDEEEESTVEMAPIMGEQPVTASNVRYITRADLMQIPVESPLPFGTLMALMNDIERSLPELKVKDAKEIRARLNQLMTKLNESRTK